MSLKESLIGYGDRLMILCYRFGIVSHRSFSQELSAVAPNHPLSNHIPEILLSRPFHGTSPESLGDPLPDEHLDSFLIHSKVDPHLPVTLDLLPQSRSAPSPVGSPMGKA